MQVHKYDLPHRQPVQRPEAGGLQVLGGWQCSWGMGQGPPQSFSSLITPSRHMVTHAATFKQQLEFLCVARSSVCIYVICYF